MSDKLLQTFKYAVAGVAVGGVTAMVGDYVALAAFQMLPPSGALSTGSVLSRQAFQVIAGASLAAGVIYAGDMVMNSIGPEEADPLFRLFYYQVAFHSMRTPMMAAQSFKGIISQILNVQSKPPPATPPPPMEPGPVMNPPCAAKPGGCGALSL